MMQQRRGTMIRPTDNLVQALYDVATAEDGDSNDDHITALQFALDEALDILSSCAGLTLTGWLAEPTIETVSDPDFRLEERYQG